MACFTMGYKPSCTGLLPAVVCDTARLTALLSADPPGATVTVLCDCGFSEGECYCLTFCPTTARVTSERALTEEERNR